MNVFIKYEVLNKNYVRFQMEKCKACLLCVELSTTYKCKVRDGKLFLCKV